MNNSNKGNIKRDFPWIQNEQNESELVESIRALSAQAKMYRNAVSELHIMPPQNELTDKNEVSSEKNESPFIEKGSLARYQNEITEQIIQARKRSADLSENKASSSAKKGLLAKYQNEITEQIIQARKRLLDLSAKNSLLNFRHSDSTHNQIRLIGCDMESVFGKLINGGKIQILFLPNPSNEPADEQTKQFKNRFELGLISDEKYLQRRSQLEKAGELSEEQDEQLKRELKNRIREELGLPPLHQIKSPSKTEWARQNHIPPEYELPLTPSGVTRSPTVYTLLYYDELCRRVTALKRKIRSDAEERGVDTFYVAFFFLEWTESPQSTIKRLAPLVLLKLDNLEQDKKNNFYIKATDGEIRTNASLREKLKDFNITLPEFDEQDDLSTYIKKVEKATAHFPHWKVRSYVTIGRFIFSRLAMYMDLGLENWPQLFTAQCANPELLATIFHGRNGSYLTQEDVYDIDRDDADVQQAPLLVAPADSSQHSAIIDAMKGKNLVIKGPPGTGKSQTITNLIANALWQNKTVLFVAEKKAALDVVYSRLNDAQLGHFCLELHSDKAKIGNILQKLNESLHFHRQNKKKYAIPYEQSSLAKRNHQEKLSLRDYYDVLQMPVGGIHQKLYDVIWHASILDEAIKNMPSEYQHIHIINADRISEDELHDISNQLSELEDSYHKYKKAVQEDAVLENLNLESVSHNDLGNITQIIQEDAEQIEALEKEIETTQQTYHLYPIETYSQLTKFIELLKNLQDDKNTAKLDYEILAHIQTKEDVQLLGEFIRHLIKYREKMPIIKAFFKDEKKACAEYENAEKILQFVVQECPYQQVGEIQTYFRNLKAEKQFFETEYQSILSCSEILFQKTSLNVQELYFILFLLKELKKNEVDFIAYFDDESILVPENAKILEVAVQKQRDQKKSKQELGEIFDMEFVDDSFESVRKAIHVIENTPHFTAWIHQEFRQACSFYRSIALSRKSKRIDILRELKKLNQFLVRQRQFDNDDQIKQAAGKYYKGIETPLEDIQKAHRFVTAVEMQLSCFTESKARHLQTQLYNKENLRQLFKIAQKIKLTDFAIESRVDPQADLQAYQCVLNQKIQNAEQMNQVIFDNVISNTATVSDIEQMYTEVYRVIYAQNNIERLMPGASSIIGDKARSEKTNIVAIAPTYQFANALIQSRQVADIGAFMNQNVLTKIRILQTALSGYCQKLDAVIAKEENVFGKMKYSLFSYCGYQKKEQMSITALRERIQSLALRKGDLFYIRTYQHALRKAKGQKYEPVISYLEKFDYPLENLVNKFGALFYKSLADTVAERVWSDFKPEEMEMLSQKIKEDDDSLFREDRDLIQQSLSQKPIPQGVNSPRVSEKTELNLINHQLSGHARPISLRKFFKRSGQAVQALTPCFLMSPLSVAQYLSPESGLTFDLLIIDEASQMYFDEALGSVLRAKQLVVVGDEKQLPPSQFFQKSFEQEMFDDEEDSDDENMGYDVQSILERCISLGVDIRELLWHYRSKDPVLISFSNKVFYNNKLKVFPTPKPETQFDGIQRLYVKGLYHAKQNEEEAEAIVKAIKAFVRNHADRSLGIATMNAPQQALIEQKVDQLIQEDAVVKKYIESRKDQTESFFVKNLENVQGDERDYIFISTVYGPNESGRVLNNFGPINGKYGHRRLNVLFTRAKYGLKLITSLQSKDINITATSSQGAKVLHDYLLYVETKRLENGRETTRQPESFFEEDVKSILECNGYEVVPQVGVQSFFIDLGVRHPQNKSYFMVGIECDGATYHSSKSARDKDCIRQKILESLGWKIYRIWSKDWFYNKAYEINKLLQYLKQQSQVDWCYPQEPYLTDDERLGESSSEVLLSKNVSDFTETKNDAEFQNDALALQQSAYTEEDNEDEVEVNDEDDEEVSPVPLSVEKTDEFIHVGDLVRYRRIDTGEEAEIQIVTTPGDIEHNKINQYTELARCLLEEGAVGEEIEVTNYTIKILSVRKPSGEEAYIS